MKKRVLLCACMLMLMAMCLSACGEKGTPPVLTVDGKEIILGESSSYNLPEGFECMLAGNAIPIGLMPANSWMSDLWSAQKDGETYAYFYVYNPSREEITYSRATIYKLSFCMNSEEKSYWAQNNILVNGINFCGMNSDEVKAAMQAFKAPKETSYGSLIYQDGQYSYVIRFGDNGLVEEVEIEMSIAKSYSEVS